MRFISLSRRFSAACLLISLQYLPLYAGTSLPSPDSEWLALKAKYPEDDLVCISRKRDITIITDETGSPVIQIKDMQTEMILSENGSDLSQSKEYFSSKTDLKKFEAYSLVPGKNKYEKIAVTNFTKSAEFDDYLYYDDSYCYTFNFPATGKGVKRCTYSETEIRDPYFTLGFFFAGHIPIDQAELTITVPESVKINFHLYGPNTTIINSSAETKTGFVIYRWNSNQSKAIEPDHLTPGIRYLCPHLIAYIASVSGEKGTSPYLGNIHDLYRWMGQNVKNLNKTESPEIHRMTDSITRGLNNPSEKVRAIYKWVQDNIKYIAIEDGDNAFVPREASKVLQRRYGDCKDQSSLLTAMIRAAGEKASLVSVGTRELPYKVSQFPAISCFNHMVAAWWNKDQPLILDGTSRHNRMEDIPASIQGKECLIDRGDGQYQLYEIPVAEADRNMQIDSIRLSLDRNSLTGTGHSTLTGQTKARITARLDGSDKEKQLAYWPQAISGASDKLLITDMKTSDLDEPDNPLEVYFAFQLPDYVTLLTGQTYINMNIERILSDFDVKADRVYPIDMQYKKEHQLVCQLTIPDQVQVGYLPAPVVFNHPLFAFSQVYEQSDHEITMKLKVKIQALLIEGKDIEMFRNMLEIVKKAYRQTISLSSR